MLPVWSVLLIITLFNQRDAIFLIYPTVLTFWVVCHYSREAVTSTRGRFDMWLFVIQISALGLLPLTKGSLIAPIFVTIGMLVYFFRQVGLARHALAVLVVPPLSFVIFWVLAGQPLDGIVGYFRTMLLMLAGYTNAMSVSGPFSEIAWFVIGAFVLVLADVKYCRGGDRLVRIIRLLSLLLLLFMGFKAGLVRHDGHAIISGHVLALAAIVVLMFSRHYSVMALVLCLVVWSVIDARYVGTSTVKIVDVLKSLVERTELGIDSRIRRPGSLDRIYTEKMAELAAKCDLPEITGSVDIYSFGQACVVAKGMTWIPRPIFQSYAAYLPDLIRLNADHLKSEHAARNLLFRIEPIDGRLPSLEDGYSWPIVSSLYTLVKFEREYALFTRREHAEKLNDYVPIANGVGQIGEVVKVPAEGAVYATLDVRPTMLGRFVSILFKLPVLKIELDLPGNMKKSYRFIPGMAQTQFLVSPLVDTTRDFVLYMEKNSGHMSSARVSAFRIVGEDVLTNVLWRKDFGYALHRRDTPGFKNVSASVFSRPETVAGKLIQDWHAVPCDGNVDVLNGMSPVLNPDVKISGNLNLAGWVAVSAPNGVPSDNIFIAIHFPNGKIELYSTTPRDRPDVSAHFKQPALIHSGYAAYIDERNLADRFSFGIVTTHKGKAVLCAPLRSVELLRQ